MDSFLYWALKEEIKLTDLQADVLLRWKMSSHRNKTLLAQELGISREAFNDRFQKIYKRFKIEQKKTSHEDFIETNDDKLERKLQEILPIFLAKYIRKKSLTRTKEKCSSIHFLGFPTPIEVSEVYIQPNMSTRIRHRQYGDINNSNEIRYIDFFGEFDDILRSIYFTNQRYSKLFIWGRRGVGKTIFLKHSAMQCINENWQNNLVPIFVSLGEILESYEQFSLIDYIKKDFNDNVDEIVQILELGLGLILIDGYDEINDICRSKIQDFIRTFNQNRYVICCQVSNLESPEGFEELEICEFSDEQINKAIEKWSKLINIPGKSRDFIDKLNQNGNSPIRIIAREPHLLNLLFIEFYKNGDFKHQIEAHKPNRIELYRHAIEQTLKNKLNCHKEFIDLLNQIAYLSFKKKYKHFTTDIIKKDLDELGNQFSTIDIQSILDQIASSSLLIKLGDHYSFSCKTFQEYFAAEYIAKRCAQESTRSQALEDLCHHLVDRLWIDIFLLVFEILENSDLVVQKMKKEIDSILLNDNTLQNFLEWIYKKSETLSASLIQKYKKASIRANYLDFDILIDPDRSLGFCLDPSFTTSFTCASFLARARRDTVINAFNEVEEITSELDNRKGLEYAMAITHARIDAIKMCLENKKFLPDFKEELDRLQRAISKIPDLKDESKFKAWHQVNGQEFGDLVRSVMIRYHSLGEVWRYETFPSQISNSESTMFSSFQKKLLQDYYHANWLLVYCMENATCITEKVIKETHESLLLPLRLLPINTDVELNSINLITEKLKNFFSFVLDNSSKESKGLLHQIDLESDLMSASIIKKMDKSELFDLHKSIFQIQQIDSSPSSYPIRQYTKDPVLLGIRYKLESAWIAYEIEEIQDLLPSECEAQDSNSLCKWFRDQSSIRSNIDDQVLDFLSNTAKLDHFRDFILSEAPLNKQFFQALIMAQQVYFSETVKLELSKNSWDECGKGNISKSHRANFLQMLENLNLDDPVSPTWEDWRPYAGHNLYFCFNSGQNEHFKSLGSLAMPELFDPYRNRAIVAGLERLHGTDVAQERCQFYYQHIEIEEHHGADFLTNIIASVVNEYPDAGMHMAIGGALRMVAMRRYSEYLADLFGIC